MTKRNWKSWARCAGVRAIKTFAQTAISTIGVTSVMEQVNWVAVGSASALAAVLSLLTSLAGIPEEEASVEDELFTLQLTEELSRPLDEDRKGEEDEY